MFQVGMVEVEITPEENGVELAGYAPRNSTGVHDPIKAIAAVIDDGHTKVAICAVDIVNLKRFLSDAVKTRLAHDAGISPECMIFAATHTHSAPGLSRGNPLNQTWGKELEDKLAQAVTEADRRRRPARMGTGRGEINGIGRNRRDPENGPADPEFKVVRFDDTDGNPIGLIVNYACHATTLGLENRLITADYPGAVRDCIKNNLSGNLPVMFLNGACGDINPGGYSAESSAMGKIFAHRNFGQMKTYGELLGNAAMRIFGAISPETPAAIKTGSLDVQLPTKQLPPPEVAAKTAAAARENFEKVQAANPPEEEYRRAWLENFYAASEAANAKWLAENCQDGFLTLPVRAIAIGNTLLLAFSGELFTGIGLAIKTASPFEHTLIIGYAHCEGGYFPTAEALRQGQGYEVRESLVGPEAIERLIESGMQLAKQLSGKV